MGAQHDPGPTSGTQRAANTQARWATLDPSEEKDASVEKEQHEPTEAPAREATIVSADGVAVRRAITDGPGEARPRRQSFTRRRKLTFTVKTLGVHVQGLSESAERERSHERVDPSKMHEGGKFSGIPTDFTPGD